MLANLQQNLTQHLSSAFASGLDAKQTEANVVRKATDTKVDDDLIGKEALKALASANGQKSDATQDAVADLLAQHYKV
jgi:hypothetical protein